MFIITLKEAGVKRKEDILTTENKLTVTMIYSLYCIQTSPATMWLRSEKTRGSTFTADSFPLTWHWALRDTDLALLHPARSSEVMFLMKKIETLWKILKIRSVDQFWRVSLWFSNQRGAERVRSCQARVRTTKKKKQHSGENHNCTRRKKKPGKDSLRKTQMRKTTREIPEDVTQYTGLCLQSQMSALFHTV